MAPRRLMLIVLVTILYIVNCGAQPCCDVYEDMDNCPTNCRSEYCPKCAKDNKKCLRPDVCPPPACVCRNNYRRAENGTCIPTEDCPPFDCSTKLNEVWTPCPPYCPTDSCSLPRVRGICPFRIGVTLECNPKCQCMDGYGRNNSGICVHFKDCPDLCPVNEEYNSCTQAICRQQNCTTRNDPIICPRIDPDICNRGCICKENFYRNDNGTCVAEDQCNADECELACDDTEVLDNCPSGCPSDYCSKSELDNKRCPQPNPCPPPACKCKFNYRRADNGTCIPTRSCPPFDCSSHPNEQYTPCPPLFPNDGCNLPRVRGICPFLILIRLECNPKCQCEDGYGRLENGTCVPFAECHPVCPNPHETYKTSLVPNCPHLGTCVSLVEKKPCDQPESAACTCKDGYLRLNETSACIPTCQCPQMASIPQCSSAGYGS